MIRVSLLYGIMSLNVSFPLFTALIDITEKSLIRDVLFIFQGIEGKIIKMDSNKDGYRLDPKVRFRFKAVSSLQTWE